MNRIATVFFLLTALAPGLAIAQSATNPVRGVAAVYAARYVGHKTASGAILDRQRPTVAHRSLSFGTRLVVVNRENGRRVTVTVNDRGPHSRHFIIDLSPAAARALHIGPNGSARVEFRIAGNP